MKPLSHHFRDLRSNWAPSGMGHEVRRTGGAFVILILIGFTICQVRPDIQDKIMKWILSVFSSADVYTEEGNLSAAGLFVNNVRACFMSILYGMIPFIYFPALSLGINAMMLGVLASYYVSNGYSMALYLAGLLPHGIFELPALVLGIACGLFLCRQVSHQLLGREETPPFSVCVVRIAQVFLLLITPLLAFAALAESYLTPWVMALFS